MLISPADRSSTRTKILLGPLLLDTAVTQATLVKQALSENPTRANTIALKKPYKAPEGVPRERWILTSLWKTAWPNSSSRPSGFERPMKHRISVTNEGKLVVTIKLKRA